MRKWLLLAAFLVSAPLRAEVVSFNEFSGLNTDVSPLQLEKGQTPDSENVVTDDGPGVQGRKGFISFSSTPATGLFDFPLSNGTRYIISVNRAGGVIKAATSNGQFSVTVSTIPTDRDTAVSVLGDRLYFANTLDGLKYWTGAATTLAASSMTVSMLSTHKGRLWAAGHTSNPRIIYGSEYLNGANFTLATNPAETDPVQITVAGALDENIQAIYSSYGDKLMWFKSNSFGGIFGSRRSNFTQRVFSDRVGVSSAETIQDCDGKLRWLGANRVAWEFDGATFQKISEDVDTLFGTILQGDGASKSAAITSQADFSLGTSNPTGSADAGIVPGSIALSTRAATFQLDTTAADFGAGTFSSLASSTSIEGAVLQLPLSGTINGRDAYTADTTELAPNCSGSPTEIDQVICTTTTFDLYSATLRLEKHGSPGTYRVSFWNGSGGPFSTRTTVISSFTFDATTTLGSGKSNYAPAIGKYTPLVSGTTYHMVLEYLSGTCDGSNYVGWYQGNSTSFGSITNNGSGSAISMNYKLTKSNFNIDTIRSRAFDVGYSTNEWVWAWGSLDASTYTSCSGGNCSRVLFLLYTSADNVTYNFQQFVTNHATPTANIARYVKYEAQIDSNGSFASPVLYDAMMNIKQQSAKVSTYTTTSINIGNLISAWGPLVANGSDGGGAYSLMFGTSTNGSSFTYSSITSGNTPTVSTAPYASVRVLFNVDVATDQPVVNDITINWSEGSTIRAASGWSNQRYWLAVATTGTTANGIILAFDKNRQWQKWSGMSANSLGMFNSRLYFGNTSGTFLTESGYSDAGSSISSYYTTPTAAPGRLDLYNNYDYIYMTTDNSDATLATTFRINGIATDYSLGSVQMNTTSGIQNFKLPFPNSEVQQGKYIGIKWATSGTSFWRILNGALYYQPSSIPE